MNWGNWTLYIFLTLIFYGYFLFRLKAKTEKERLKFAYIFWIALAFFVIFEFVFIDSIFKDPLFHFFGLITSIVYALSIYLYLKSIKKDIDKIFYKLLEEGQGNISVLSFMQATQLPPEEITEYLNNKLQELKGSRKKTEGNIYYRFNKW
ncbi:MAG TPA: hypothetical protein DCF68_02555 [Cyanothece sp. UBA12306]|nr:hypothetical protein [Cyanothece sp. UBA12306]